MVRGESLAQRRRPQFLHEGLGLRLRGWGVEFRSEDLEGNRPAPRDGPEARIDGPAQALQRSLSHRERAIIKQREQLVVRVVLEPDTR